MSASPEFQPLDTDARRTALVLLVVIALLGASILWFVEGRLERLRNSAWEEPDVALASARPVVLGVGLAASLGLLLLAAWGARLAYRIRSSGRYPPPGMRVIQETRIRRGEVARRLALATYLMAVLLAAGAIALPLMLARLVRLLSPP